MGLPRDLYSRWTNSKTVTSLDDFARQRVSPRLAFLRRRVRFRGNSSVSIPLGVVLLFPSIVLIIILILILTHPSEKRIFVPSAKPPRIQKINEQHDKVFVNGCLEPQTSLPRANAAFVVLARNKELEGVIQSMKSIERHFNHWFNYPYVFLNDGEFNSTFKEEVRKYASSECTFGQIDKSMWGFPDWVDHDVAKEAIAKQGDRAIMYGGMESYHHMCRFYSGHFYNHPLLDKYKWYWRLEPEIKYFCDITYDPFLYMEKHNKTYGFTIAVKELRETVPNLFRYASAYKRLNNIKSTRLWYMFAEQQAAPKDKNKDSKLPEEIQMSQPGSGKLPPIDGEMMEKEKYNMCHFWSNFEIARLDFFRSKKYEDFFQMLDRSGGFWSERWGDAPIHSLATGVLLDVKDVHYFRDFGYRHTTIMHCPANAPARQLPHKEFFHQEELNKNPQKAREEDNYWAKPDPEVENGVGCRCRCDTDISDVEFKPGSCLNEWARVAGGFTNA